MIGEECFCLFFVSFIVCFVVFWWMGGFSFFLSFFLSLSFFLFLFLLFRKGEQNKKRSAVYFATNSFQVFNNTVAYKPSANGRLVMRRMFAQTFLF